MYTFRGCEWLVRAVLHTQLREDNEDQGKGTVMLPDYRGAKAAQDIKLASAEYVNRRTPKNPGNHSLIEQLDVQIEVKLHELAEGRQNRPVRRWQWPHPLTP